MSVHFRELSKGDKFKLTPYDIWWSEKLSDTTAAVDLSSTTWRAVEVKEDCQVIPWSEVISQASS